MPDRPFPGSSGLSEPRDIFFSAEDGLAETRHVYLNGNHLPEAWAGRRRFVVSELGFGTGLNLLALATLADQVSRPGQPVPELIYQSVEWAPRPAEDFGALATRWPELTPAAEALYSVYQPQAGWNRWAWRWGTIRLFVGDARQLPREPVSFEPADAWFLDGFAPAVNPELWSPDLLSWVGLHTRPGGTAATYSAAGVVKRGLRDAGFQVVRSAGYGPKRHMVSAVRSPSSG